MRVLRSSRLAGFSAIEPPAVVHSPLVWAANEGSVGPHLERQVRRLDGLGFLGGVDEQLFAGKHTTAEVDSVVEEFRLHQGADGELSAQYTAAWQRWHTTGASFERFVVVGIPGAIGYDAGGPAFVHDTVAFAACAFYYAVRSTVPRRAHGAVGRAAVIAAAIPLYRRVRNAPGLGPSSIA